MYTSRLATRWSVALLAVLASAVFLACLSLALVARPLWGQTAPAVSFGKGALAGESSVNPTSLQFGPDGRLYVAQQDGVIKAYTVKRDAANAYSVAATETIDLVQKIPNHDDDGSANTSVKTRQVTGILVAGTSANPIIYASSSDPRIGGGFSGEDINLDTNSGVVSRLTKGASGWARQDLVRGLPRSEENHSINGMQLSSDGKTLYLAVGGNTNQGAPSKNFALLPEYALSAAILSIDLEAIGNTTHDLPTIGSSPNQPFGGNDGNDQAKLVSGGPVQVHAPGFRNAYDLVVAQSGKMYTIDNGGNEGWGGKPVGVDTPNCTNGVSEPGQTNQDNFHYVSGQGYYGGHPNPTRANENNTFGGQTPIGTANAVECNYQKPADNTLTTFPASTNGIDEYTASNFDGAMQGDLLAASFDGTIYRLQLNDTGTALASTEPLIQNLDSQPLDLTAQGDNEPFPGTIWAVAYGADTIVAFEPAAGGGSCDASSPGGDADGDGYANSDEQSAGTDPCSAADVPADYDKDKVSNKTDSDDDNDGQPDTSDPFAVDEDNGKTTSLPVRYTWDPGASNPGGLEGYFGFTGLMTNGTANTEGANYESLYDPAKMTVGGAAGAFTVDKVPEGDAFKTDNNQENGFQSGVSVSPSTGVFTARTRMAAPFAGITPQNQQSMGLFIGTGDQDNYAKLVVHANSGSGGIQFAKEVGGSFASRPQAAVAMPGPDYVDLYLTVDPAANTVQPSYVVSTNGQEGPRTNLGGTASVPAGWVDGQKALAFGFISTSKGIGPEFPATWDFVEVVSGDGTTEPPAESTSQALFTIDPGGTLEGSSTYGAGSFKIKNTSPDGQKIKNLKIDLGSSVLPDMVFDPKGTAGDTTAKCFTANSGATDVGLVAPADKCASPFSEPRDSGYEAMELSFTDFGPGETFTFSVDVDPTSIKGFSGSGGAGSVSGLELTGALATVGYDDGSSWSAQTYRVPAGVTGSTNVVKASPPAKPTIEVVGVSAPAKVQQAGQTVRVSGPAGSNVSLMVLEGGMFTEPPNGFYDLDPFEANSAVKVSEKSATIGSGGTVDIPVTLTKSSTSAGLNYMVAAVKDAGSRSGPTSNVVVLEYDDTTSTDTTPPTVTGKTPSDGATGVATGANVTTNFSEAMDEASVETNGNFILTKQGATTPVSASVTHDSATQKATLDPSNDLEAGATYTATVKGGSGGVKDAAGNPLVADETWSFTTAVATGCTITGTSASDTLTGTSGDDVICGGGSADIIKGLGGNDVLRGEAGADKLFGGEGDDTLDGGTGKDIANFSGSAAGVTASLIDNTATGEGSDTLTSIEDLIGSPKPDTLVGSDVANTLKGGGASDTVRGGLGNDSLVGDGGPDYLFGEGGADSLNSKDGVSGNDSLDGGPDTDTCVKDATEKSIVSCEQ